MLITEVRQWDWDGDGNPDTETMTEFEYEDGKLVSQFEQTRDFPGWWNGYEAITYTYNDLGQEVFRDIQSDPNNGGIPDVTHVYSTYDEGGFIDVEHWQHMEWGSDNVVRSDLIKDFDWRDDGQPLRLREDYYDATYGGEQSNLDWREENWTYNSAGDVTSWAIEDYSFFDVEVTRFYNYRYGLLANIKLQDEVRFGDERPRTVESFSYNSDGSMKESTEWGVYTKYGYAPWVQTQYTESNPLYDITTKLIDLDGDFRFEFKEVTELTKVMKHHYGAGEPETLLISSYDKAGNLLNQDLTLWEYNEHGLRSMIIDLGNNNTRDEYLARFVEPDLPDLMVA